MPNSFHQRCQLALTHPVTLGAVALLLVNDWLLKPLWQSDWTTGKLSDFAWMVFFPPLLAFLLSLAARNNARAQRAAFFAAYVGLPLLYAAYNTYAPLHDWINGGFMFLSGALAGSPLDPWDSLVIPPAMVVALWVWRHSAHSREGIHIRLHLYAVVIAALATVATNPDDPASRPWEVGVDSKGRVVMEGGEYDRYHFLTLNGGPHWWQAAGGFEEDIAWGTSSVETPRGTYSIEGQEIKLVLPSGESRTVYSVQHLSHSSNHWANRHSTRDKRQELRNSFLLHEDVVHITMVATEPINIVFDEQSQYVIASMGILGVLVGNAKEEWVHGAVLNYAPPDFSIDGKLDRFLSVRNLAAALTVTFCCLAVVLAKSSRSASDYDAPKDGLIVSLRNIMFMSLSYLAFLVGLVSIVLFGLILISVTSSWISYLLAFAGVLSVIAFAWWYFHESTTRQMLTFPLAYLGIFLGTTFSELIVFDTIYIVPVPEVYFLGAGTVTAFLAFVANHPQVRQLPAVIAAFVAMNVLLPLPFLLWLAGGVTLWLATLGAAALLTLTAIALYKRLVRQAGVVASEGT